MIELKLKCNVCGKQLITDVTYCNTCHTFNVGICDNDIDYNEHDEKQIVLLIRDKLIKSNDVLDIDLLTFRTICDYYDFDVNFKALDSVIKKYTPKLYEELTRVNRITLSDSVRGKCDIDTYLLRNLSPKFEDKLESYTEIKEGKVTTYVNAEFVALIELFIETNYKNVKL